MSTLSLPVSILLILLRGIALVIVVLSPSLPILFQPASMLLMVDTAQGFLSPCKFTVYVYIYIYVIAFSGLFSLTLSLKRSSLFFYGNLESAVVFLSSFVPAGLGSVLNLLLTFPSVV